MSQCTQQGRALGAGLLIFLMLVALAAATWWVWSRSAGEPTAVSAMASLLEASVPEDDRAINDALWTLDAQLQTEEGHRVVLSLTLVRLAGPLADAPRGRESDLAAEGFMLGRLVLIPIDAPLIARFAGNQRQQTSPFFRDLSMDGETVLESLRFSRIAGGLAGSAMQVGDDPLRTDKALEDPGLARDDALAIDGYSMSQILPRRLWVESIGLEQQGAGRWRLSVREPGVELALQLEAREEVLRISEILNPGAAAGQQSRETIQGDWLPKLAIRGELLLNGQPLPISGQGWLEATSGRAASLLSEGQGQLVADRFVLQLDQGDALMCLRLRRREGGGVPLNNCALVSPEAGIRRFDRRDVQLESIKDADWRSPASDLRYPLRWTLKMPGRAYQLSALRPDRELPIGIPVWSGPLMVRDDAGQPLGHGRMDLTGDPAGNPLF